MLKNKKITLVDGMYGDATIINFFIAFSKILSPKTTTLCIQSLGSPIIKDKAIRNIKFLRYKPYFVGLILSLRHIKSIINSIFIAPTILKKIFVIDSVDFYGDFIDTIGIKYGINFRKLNRFKLLFIYVYELSFFLYIKYFFENNHNRIEKMIMGDTAYRYGYFAKFSSIYKIPILCNIDNNAIIFNHYENGYIIDSVPRKIYTSDIDIIIKNIDFIILDFYFEKRFSGEIKQHDVLKAFTKTKNYKELNKLNSIVENKDESSIIVTVFAHIFSDAPHNIPGLLFDDFYDWFVSTVESLSKNKNVILLIKEHPSANLYVQEKDLVSKIVKNNFKDDNIFIANEIQSNVLIDKSDFIVTASGTVIYEALYKEKNVVIASKKTFDIDNLVHDFSSKKEYLNFLEHLNHNSSFCLKGNIQLKAIIYIHFIIYNNRDYFLNFPVTPFIRGEKLEYSSFTKIYNYFNNDHKFKKAFHNFLESNQELFRPKLDEI